MINIPKVKVGIVAVSRDCFPESLAVNRRKALVEAYTKKYDAADIYECPICIVESEIDMVNALEDVKKAAKAAFFFCATPGDSSDYPRKWTVAEPSPVSAWQGDAST